MIRQVHAGKKRIPVEIAAHLVEHYSDEAFTVREIEVLKQIAGVSNFPRQRLENCNRIDRRWL